MNKTPEGAVFGAPLGGRGSSGPGKRTFQSRLHPKHVNQRHPEAVDHHLVARNLKIPMPPVIEVRDMVEISIPAPSS